jgi:small subunit ribosomal protein S6
MAVFIPDLSDEDLATEIERVSGFITDEQGTISEVLTDNPWGRRRLAYTIRHNSVDYRDGIYAVFHFDSQPSVMTEIERELKLDTNIIRYLLVHDDPLAGEKSQPVDTRELAEDDAEAAPEGEATTAVATEEAPAETAPVAEEAATEAPAEEAASDVETPAAEEAAAPAADEAPDSEATTEE